MFPAAYDQVIDTMARRIVTNRYLISRVDFYNQINTNPEGRDFDKEFGYPTVPITPQFYYNLYEKVSIAQRVVNVFPSECWSVYPKVFEQEGSTKNTPFEKKWDEVNHKLNVWSYLDRIDELSGIGNFGCLYLGLADGKDPSEPAPGVDDNGKSTGKVENELLYMRTFDQSAVNIEQFETDFTNPRYGQPKMYSFNVVNPVMTSSYGNVIVQTDSPHSRIRVHWSRVIHVADNRKTSEVFGLPRMRPVLPEIMDIRKVRGGSAEMYWRGALPGYSFETHPNLGNEVTLDKESVREEFENYSNGLQRYIALTGLSAKSLAPQVTSPHQHLDEQYRSISAVLGMPLRILMGAESGHLASSQDASTWNRRLAKRQIYYLNPNLVNPTIDRLILVGVLPPLKKSSKYFTTSWDDLNSLSAADKADIALKKTQTMMTYISGDCEQILPVVEFYTDILGLSVAQATEIIQKVVLQQRLTQSPNAMGGDPNDPNNQDQEGGGDPNKAKTDTDGKVKMKGAQGGGRNNGDDNGQGRPKSDERGNPRK